MYYVIFNVLRSIKFIVWFSIYCVVLNMGREALDGFQDVTFLPSRASFSTTLLKNCGRGKSLRTTTCL